MFTLGRKFALFLTSVVLIGCAGRVRGVTGGTAGELHCSGAPLGDIRITIHQIDPDGTEPIGFAETRSDGAFELVTMEAAGPLKLVPGDYCYTLESVGAPISIPKEFTKPETTPMKMTWAADDLVIDLDFQPGNTSH